MRRLHVERPFLSHTECVQKDLDIQEYTDPEHNPMIPHTLVLELPLVVYSIYNGYRFGPARRSQTFGMISRAVTSELRPDRDLSTPGLREAWEVPRFARASTAGISRRREGALRGTEGVATTACDSFE